VVYPAQPSVSGGLNYFVDEPTVSEMMIDACQTAILQRFVGKKPAITRRSGQWLLNIYVDTRTEARECGVEMMLGLR
jgi:hypothetical protein